ADKIGVGDRSPWTAERQSDVQVGVRVAQFAFVGHWLLLRWLSLILPLIRAVTICRHASPKRAGDSRSCNTPSRPDPRAAASLQRGAPATSPTARPPPCLCTSRRRCRTAA